MPLQLEYEILEFLSKGKILNQTQYVFNKMISEIVDYLKLQPLYRDIILKLLTEDKFEVKENISILDFAVRRIFQNEKLIIEINETYRKFLPFILLREAYYCFIDKKASKLVKICINQIVENDLRTLSAYKEWKNLIRDILVDSDFMGYQYDKYQKFFNIEAKEPFENPVQFFFKEIRDEALLSYDVNIKSFYDIIFERYTFKTSRSLFNPDIVETLRIIIYLFYLTKSYINISDYQTLFKRFKENQQIDTKLSLRKFNENLQWINKSSSIAPSYDVSYSPLELCRLRCTIKFHPLLEKKKIKTLLEEWPFYLSQKFSENSFATEMFLGLILPKIYLKDLLKFFENLEESGYIIQKKLYLTLSQASIINLNYFTDISNLRKIIDPENINYKKKYEIETLLEYPIVYSSPPLSMFDFIVLERGKFVSITGLTFDKRIETLNAIKEDVENELRKQSTINKEFKDGFNQLSKYKSQFLQFLNRNQEQGFFHLRSKLNRILCWLNLFGDILNGNPQINNIYQFQKFLNTFSLNIEDHLLIRDEKIKRNIYTHLLPLYFKSRQSFREEVEKLNVFFNVLNACYSLKIVDLNEIKRIANYFNIAEEIYHKREKIYENGFKSVSSYKITNEKIESTIERFLNNHPPIIKPFLINTILTSTFAKYYPDLILKNTRETREKLKKFKIYFPRAYIYEMKDLATKRNYLNINLYFLNIKEKGLFISILYSYFKDSVIKIKRYFWSGLIRASLYIKDFYDFKNNQYFYTKHLFEELYIYSQKILGKKLKWPEYPMNNEVKDLLWSGRKNMNDLVNTVNKRVLLQDINFNLGELDNLIEFRKNLETNLLNISRFRYAKAKRFFKRCIDSIKILPSFQKFGFSQYYLYIRPFHYNEVDFRLLFQNNFQKIKYSSCFETIPSLIHKSIFPYRTPNKSYLNWLIKSKKNVSEFCLFCKKKIYDILHFNHNLTKEAWHYSSLRFKLYIQNILFNPSYEPKIENIRVFDLDTLSNSEIYSPKSQEFIALSQIYNRHSIDIKSYLGTKKYTTINYITDLLKKKLIFPYLSLTNLDFQEKVSIILPNVKNEFNEKIIKIFSFFNICHIYEIEGELYIYGFEDIRPFENGFLINIWFPKCEMDEFFEIFDLIFQYFEIKHYLILTDLVDGKQLLKSVFGNLVFLNSYNPLKNLIWNDKDKIWMNHKLFNEKFEPIYPDLLYGEK
ncbi:MAG: hypothetical protein ACFE8M_00395 [Candidatus Hermodarchaeota archaeon]